MNQEIIIQAVEQCIERANKMFDVEIPFDLAFIHFMNNRDYAAKAWMTTVSNVNRFGINFHRFIAITQPDLVVRSLVPHEVAHLVMFYKQHVQGLLPNATLHGKEWGAICVALGGVASAYVRAHVNVPKLIRDSIYHKVTTATNFVVYITKYRYNKIRQGERYRLHQTHEVIGKKNVSKIPVKRSQLISERKLCYIHEVKRV